MDYSESLSKHNGVAIKAIKECGGYNIVYHNNEDVAWLLEERYNGEISASLAQVFGVDGFVMDEISWLISNPIEDAPEKFQVFAFAEITDKDGQPLRRVFFKRAEYTGDSIEVRVEFERA